MQRDAYRLYPPNGSGLVSRPTVHGRGQEEPPPPKQVLAPTVQLQLLHAQSRVARITLSAATTCTSVSTYARLAPGAERLCGGDFFFNRHQDCEGSSTRQFEDPSTWRIGDWGCGANHGRVPLDETAMAIGRTPQPSCSSDTDRLHPSRVDCIEDSSSVDVMLQVFVCSAENKPKSQTTPVRMRTQPRNQHSLQCDVVSLYRENNIRDVIVTPCLFTAQFLHKHQFSKPQCD